MQLMFKEETIEFSNFEMCIQEGKKNDFTQSPKEALLMRFFPDPYLSNSSIKICNKSLILLEISMSKEKSFRNRKIFIPF